MPEAIIGAVWAFSWGTVAASGALVGAILGLTANLRHRAIAALMSLGAGVLLSAASFKVASEALILGGATLTIVGMVAGAATFSVANAALVSGWDRKRCGESASRSPRKPRYPAVESRLRSAPHLMPCRRPWSLASPCGSGDPIRR